MTFTVLETAICLNYGISCVQENLFDSQNLFLQLTYFVFIHISEKVNYQKER